MKEKATRFFSRKRDAFLNDPLFHANEVQANRMMGIVLFNSGLVMIIVWICERTGLFSLAKENILNPAVFQGLAEIVLLLIVSRIVREDTWWLKYLLLAGLTVIYARMDMMMTHKVVLLIAIPVICSCRYYSVRLTNGMALLTTILFAVSAALGANNGLFDLNELTLPVGTTLTTTTKWLDSAVWEVGYDKHQFILNVLLFAYLPKWLMFSVIAVISAKIAKHGRQMVLEQRNITEKNARIETELSLAKTIQADMLPGVFPPFPERKDLDLYAMMDTAKEVGGDFYDFFLTDENHLAMVVADVSNKGVPAALFMMAAKMAVQNNAMSGLSPVEVMEAVNRQLCLNNREQMFVTVWFGILDLRDGLLRSVNAGHLDPAVRSPGGRFEMIREKHGLFVGGMENIRYKEQRIRLEPGSMLFQYTDGVTEAANREEELFGTERMLKALNRMEDENPKALLLRMKQEIGSYADGAPQHDDITMLCLKYNGKEQ